MILSIIIPTYNRSGYLQPLVEDILECIKNANAQVELIILNNASTDNTAKILEDLKKDSACEFNFENREINIGMEGNITNGILTSNGKYTWMLSDHQTVEKQRLTKFLESLPKMDFDYAYARLAQWGSIMEEYAPTPWTDLREEQKGAFLFTLGNMSAFIFRSSLAQTSAAELFKCCYFGYPHLGVLSKLSESSIFLETPILTHLPHSTGNMNHSYNIINTRYSKNYECIKFILKNKYIKFKKKYFFTQDYKQAFRADILNLLLTKDQDRKKTAKSILEIIPANNGVNSAIAIACLFILITIPSRIRIPIAQRLKNKFKKIIIRPNTSQ